MIAIDLGTHTTCVAHYLEKGVIIPFEGKQTVPTCIAFSDQLFIGEAAQKEEAPIWVKKLWGGPPVKILYEKEEYYLTPEQLTGLFLKELKKNAEKYLDRPMTEAIFTISANAGDAQRQCLKEAAAMAKLKIVRIMSDASAALYTLPRSKEVLLVDLGASLDVSRVSLDKELVHVQTTRGDSTFGGAFDQLLADELGVNLTVAEQLKCRLSEEKEVTWETKSMTRSAFETLSAPLLARFTHYIVEARDQLPAPTQIVMIGGGMKMPLLQATLKSLTNPLTNQVTMLETQAIALGAAQYGGTKHLLLEVTPLSLGVEKDGKYMAVVIPRNTTLPYSDFRLFSTYKDNQTMVPIKVYEGERPLTKDNHLLGTFTLRNIPEAKRGNPKLKVKFNVNVNGILHVSATNENTKEVESLEIKTERHTPEEIQALIDASEKFKTYDDRLIEFQNRLAAAKTWLSEDIVKEMEKETYTMKELQKYHTKLYQLELYQKKRAKSLKVESPSSKM